MKLWQGGRGLTICNDVISKKNHAHSSITICTKVTLKVKYNNIHKMLMSYLTKPNPLKVSQSGDRPMWRN